MKVSEVMKEVEVLSGCCQGAVRYQQSSQRQFRFNE